MPASPEIGKPDGRIRGLEIVWQRKTEAISDPNGTKRVSCEVEKDLSGESKRRQPCVKN